MAMQKGLQDSTKEIFDKMEQGYSIEDAYKLVKGGKELSRQTKYDLLKKQEQYSLQNPKRVKKAALAIDKTLSGKAVGDARPPNASDVLAAAKQVLDRAEPIINVNQNMNVNAEVSPVNLDRYRTAQAD